MLGLPTGGALGYKPPVQTNPFGTNPFGAPASSPFNLPDYQSIIDRLLGPMKGLNAAQTAALQARINQQGDLGRENYRLAIEGLTQAHKTAMKGISDTLTARGMINSGDKPYATGQENQQFNRATELQSNNLLAYLQSLQDQLVQQKLQSVFGEQQAAQDLFSQIVNQYTPTPVQGASGNPFGG